MVIDTACSSSMVAIYQACRALNNRDCNAAVAGGVNVITSPDVRECKFLLEYKLIFPAPDRCTLAWIALTSSAPRANASLGMLQQMATAALRAVACLS